MRNIPTASELIEEALEIADQTVYVTIVFALEGRSDRIAEELEEIIDAIVGKGSIEFVSASKKKPANKE